MVENESVMVAPPTLHNVPFNNHKARREHMTWNDAHTTHNLTPNKFDNGEAFDMTLGLTVKLDDNETRLGAFTRVDGLADTEHWSGPFSPTSSQPQIRGLHNFSLNPTSVSSVSPQGADSAPPPTSTLPESLRFPGPLHGPLPESFQPALHSPGLETRVQQGQFLDDTGSIFRPFGNAQEEGMWFKNPEVGNKALGMQHPFPLSGVSTNGSLFSSIATSTLPHSEHSYGYQQQSYPSLFTHMHGHPYPSSATSSIFLNTGHVSPPATASTSSSSSGSSSPPFTRGDIFDNKPNTDGTWRQVNPSPHGFPPTLMHSDQFSFNPPPSVRQPGAQNWNVDTCDPRRIISEREREELHSHRNGYGDTIIPIPSHSPALSDLSGSSGSGEPVAEANIGSGRGRPRRVDIALGGSSYVPAAAKGAVGGAGCVRSGTMSKIKKKQGGLSAGGQVLGMGLEDVDERALEFTSRHDTKPTRMLRRQCSNCRTWRDVSAWRRSIMQVGHIVCNKCGLYEKAHQKSRPLNDRGEFVRPGKHVSKAAVSTVAAAAVGAGRGRGGRVRTLSGEGSAPGVGVMRFDLDDEEQEK